MNFYLGVLLILMFLPHSQISARSKETANGVGPLLETEWGQGGLYQTFTPRIRAVSGFSAILLKTLPILVVFSI